MQERQASPAAMRRYRLRWRLVRQSVGKASITIKVRSSARHADSTVSDAPRLRSRAPPEAPWLQWLFEMRRCWPRGLAAPSMVPRARIKRPLANPGLYVRLPRAMRPAFPRQIGLASSPGARVILDDAPVVEMISRGGPSCISGGWGAHWGAAWRVRWRHSGWRCLRQGFRHPGFPLRAERGKSALAPRSLRRPWVRPVEQQIAGVRQDRNALVLLLVLGLCVQRQSKDAMGLLHVRRGGFVAEAEKLVEGLLVGCPVQCRCSGSA